MKLNKVMFLWLLIMVATGCKKNDSMQFTQQGIISSNANATLRPVSTVAPVITGYKGVGNEMYVSTGSWLNDPVSFTYQWKNAGVDIGGATSSTYTSVSGDLGDAITCVVTATNGAGSTSQVSSNSFTVIDAPNTIFNSTDLGLWVDWMTPTGKTFISGSENKDVATNASRDTNGYSFAPNEAGREIRQGPKVAYIGDINYAQHASSTALYNYLHDGTTDVEIIFRFMPIESSTTTEYKIFNNNAGTSAQTGIAITYDNRSSQSRTNALCIFVTKSSAGNFVYNAVFNDFFTVGTLTTVRIRISGTTLSVYQDDSTTAFGTSSRLNTPASGDASGSLTLFRVSNAATFATRCLTKDFIVVKRNLTNGEVASVHTYLSTNASETFGTIGNGNVYSVHGQSNAKGTTNSSSPDASLQGLQTKTYIYGGYTGVSVHAGQKLKLEEYGVNVGSPDATWFGPELSFINSMDDNTSVGKVFIAKYAVSGTALSRPGSVRQTTPDWNVALGNSADCLPWAMRIVRWTMDEVQYVFDYTPIYRGMIWRQGESDALNSVNQATYQADFEALCKYISDAIVSYGYSMSKARVYVSKISNAGYSPARPTMADIDAAMVAAESSSTAVRGLWIGFEYLDTSAISVASDGTHFNSAAQKTHGEGLYTLAIPFYNE